MDRLGLQPHPEGGFYRETYRSALVLPGNVLPHHAGPRACATAIYFLMPRGTFSALHHIASDELWHFHLGAPLTIHCLDDRGHTPLVLGPPTAPGHAPQHLVTAGTVFGACLEHPGPDYALVGCTVSPGFDFADFEMPTRAALMSRFPAHGDVVQRLTRS